MPPGQANLTRRAKSMSPEAEPHPPFDAWNSPWPQTRAAVTALVDDFADRLVRYAFRQVGNLQDAEDVVQEVFVRAFGEQTKRSGISAAGPYLYRSVGNACTDLLRKRNRAAVYCEEIDIEAVLGLTNGPAEAVRAAESMRRAEALLQELPTEQAETVRLRVFDGLRLNEIAQVAGCSINTVSSRLRYAFQRLRSLVAAEKE